jgi:hypothetical protein
MKKFVINLEEKELTLSEGNGMITEMDCVLKVWQDLRKLNSSQSEDHLIENILEQVLKSEYGEEIPKGYVGEKITMTDANMDALKQKAAAEIEALQRQQEAKKNEEGSIEV